MTGSQPENRYDSKPTTGSHRWWFLVVGGLVLLALLGVGGYLLSKQTTPGTRFVYQMEDPSLAASVALPLRRRLAVIGNVRVRVDEIDPSQIEVTLPSRNRETVELTKALIGATGVMRFLVLANPADHPLLIDQAIEQAKDSDAKTSRDVRGRDGEVLGRWVTISQFTDVESGQQQLRVNVAMHALRNSKTGEIVEPPAELLNVDSERAIAKWMGDQSIESLDALVSIDPQLEVGGEDLSYAGLTFDQMGNPAIAMSFTGQGSARLFALTTTYAPYGNQQRQLGIILDDQLFAAPNILSPIQSEARITGNFTREEVDRMVQILKAGQLPVAMPNEPQSETQVEVSSWLAEFF